MTRLRDYTMPNRDGRRHPPKLPLADLEAEDRYRIMLYQIYGNQNPTVKTRRGRAGLDL